MTQDEMIILAKKAGLKSPDFLKLTVSHMSIEQLHAFTKLVEDKATEEANARANSSWALMCKKMVAFEREACAKVCEDLDHKDWAYMSFDQGTLACADAIRAKEQQ